jgi:hypothetical protein
MSFHSSEAVGVELIRAHEREQGGVMHGGRGGISGPGWAVLIVLVLLLLSSAGEGFFFLLVGGLCLWMWNRYRKTGQAPNLSRMIDDLFTKHNR